MRDCQVLSIRGPAEIGLGDNALLIADVRNDSDVDLVCRVDFSYERQVGDMFLAAGAGGMTASVVGAATTVESPLPTRMLNTTGTYRLKACAAASPLHDLAGAEIIDSDRSNDCAFSAPFVLTH